MNSYSLLFSAFVAIGLVLGMIFLLVFRRLRKHTAQLTVVERLGGRETVFEPEFAELESAELESARADLPETIETKGIADQARSQPSPGHVAEVEPQVEEGSPKRWESDRRIRTEIMSLLQAEEEQRLRIDAATRRRGQAPSQKTEQETTDPDATVDAPKLSGQQETGLADTGTAAFGRLKSDSSAERALALSEIARVGGEDAFHSICEALDDHELEVRNAAARALHDFHSDRAASFTRALEFSSPARRRRLASALYTSGLASEAVNNLTSESAAATYDAFSVLFLMVKAGEVRLLMRTIEDSQNTEARIAIIKLLALSGQVDIVPALRRLAVRDSLSSEVRSAVVEAIDQLSSQAPGSSPSLMLVNE